MLYLKTELLDSNLEDPILIYHEIDENGNELRKVEIFQDGRIAYADKSFENGTELSYVKITYNDFEPYLEGKENSDGLNVYVISCKEFEQIWNEFV